MPCSRIRAVVVFAMVLAACGAPGGGDSPTVSVPPLPGSPTFTRVEDPPPDLDPASVAAGTVLYGEFCAQCHGADLAGDPGWRSPNADGSYPPPPHDATGHTWHHDDATLVRIISVGSDFEQSRMPAFADLLTEEEILAILDFIKSGWGPDERSFQWEQTVRSQQG